MELYLDSGKRPHSSTADVKTILKMLLQAERVLSGYNEQALVNYWKHFNEASRSPKGKQSLQQPERPAASQKEVSFKFSVGNATHVTAKRLHVTLHAKYSFLRFWQFLS
jgi:hypothetical protein